MVIHCIIHVCLGHTPFMKSCCLLKIELLHPRGYEFVSIMIFIVVCLVLSACLFVCVCVYVCVCVCVKRKG